MYRKLKAAAAVHLSRVHARTSLMLSLNFPRVISVLTFLMTGKRKGDNKREGTERERERQAGRQTATDNRSEPKQWNFSLEAVLQKRIRLSRHPVRWHYTSSPFILSPVISSRSFRPLIHFVPGHFVPGHFVPWSFRPLELNLQRIMPRKKDLFKM
jgi:hypothetical protein